MLLFSIPSLIAALAAKTSASALRLVYGPAIHAWSGLANCVKPLFFPWKKNCRFIVYPVSETHDRIVSPYRKNENTLGAAFRAYIRLNEVKCHFVFDRRENGLGAKYADVGLGVPRTDNPVTDRPVPIKITSNKCIDQLPIYRRKTECESLVRGYAEPIEGRRKWLAGNQKPGKGMLLGWIRIKLNRVVCLHRRLQPKKVISVFHSERDRKLPSCYGPVCGDKSKPIGFGIGVDDIEKSKVCLIFNRPMGAHISPLRNVFRIGVYHEPV